MKGETLKGDKVQKSGERPAASAKGADWLLAELVQSYGLDLRGLSQRVLRQELERARQEHLNPAPAMAVWVAYGFGNRGKALEVPQVARSLGESPEALGKILDNSRRGLAGVLNPRFRALALGNRNPDLNRPAEELLRWEAYKEALAQAGIRFTGELIRNKEFDLTTMGLGREERRQLKLVLADLGLRLETPLKGWKPPDENA